MWILCKAVLVTLALANIRYYWHRTAIYRGKISTTGCSLEETRSRHPDTPVQQQTHVLGWLHLSSLPHLQSILGDKRKTGEAEFYFINTNNKSNNHTLKSKLMLLLYVSALGRVRIIKHCFSFERNCFEHMDACLLLLLMFVVHKEVNFGSCLVRTGRIKIVDIVFFFFVVKECINRTCHSKLLFITA